SRRRHTRSYGDWSSDVCSSDLDVVQLAVGEDIAGTLKGNARHGEGAYEPKQANEAERASRSQTLEIFGTEKWRRKYDEEQIKPQIGRASCRERGEMTVDAGSWK